nr:DUF11 domain-containing protein [Lysinibacter cavernae]
MIAVDAAISVSKTANPARIAAGAAGSFTLSPRVLDVGVQGSDTAKSVTLTDTIPAGLTFLPTAESIGGETVQAPSIAPSSVVVNADGSTTVTWEFSSLTRGQEPVVTYWARAALTARGDYVNTVAVSSPSDGTSPAPGDLPIIAGDRHMAQATVSVDGVAGIAVSKIALNPVITAGEDFSWRVDVANGSTVTPQTGASVIDVLPFLGDGRAGSTSRVPATTNEAEYRLTGPVSLPAGATAQYTTDDAEAVQLSQTLGSGQGTTYGAGVTWQDFAAVENQLAMVTGIKVTFATMPPLSNTHFTYTLTHVTGSEGGIWANNATFRTVEAPLGVLSNTVTTTMVPGPVSIDLVKSASAPANGVSYVAGETINYGFVVTNTGSRELHDVTLSESNFVNGAGEALELTTPITATQPADFDGTLAPGASVTYSASYDVTVADQMAGGEIANTADVSGTPNAGDAVTDESTAAVNVDKAEPGIELVKSVANAPADGVAFTPGEQIAYNFTVRNTGNVPLLDVTVDEGSFTNGNGAELKLDGGPTAPDGFDGTLTPGQQVVFTGTYTVTAADVSGALLNVATASAATPAGITPGEVTDTAKVSTTVAGPEAAAVIGHTAAEQLTLTGANSGFGIAVLALLLILFGAVLLRPTTLMKRLRSRTDR